MTEREQEKKNQRIALLSSIGISGAVVLLMFIIIAWRAPDPPLPEYGIEVNFGLDMEGSGEVQPETPVGSEGTQEEEPQQEETVVQNKVEESAPVEQEIVSKVESPVKVKETKEEVKPIEKPKQTEEKPKEEVKVAYKANTQTNDSQNKTTDGKTGTAGSHGDDKNKTGDKGNPEGSLDAKSMFGGGKGFKEGLDEFAWPDINTPQLPDESNGTYVFEIIVDQDGYVKSVNTISRGISSEAERKLRDYIFRLEFIPKGSNIPPQSYGKITFKVVSK